jgi:predicted DNA-binding transcriptional regulator YafY
MGEDSLDVATARAWARKGRKIALVYRDASGATTERTVWPVAVAYLDAGRVLVAWCELRQDFRDFRADRVVEAEFLEERFPARPADLRKRWLAGLGAKAGGA